MLKYYDFSGASFLVDKRFECENASENAAARFDLVHNPTVPYLTDSKFTPFSAPSRGRLYARVRCEERRESRLGRSSYDFSIPEYSTVVLP